MPAGTGPIRPPRCGRILGTALQQPSDVCGLHPHPRLAFVLLTPQTPALFLVVYVEDFKLAGPTSNLPTGWEITRQKVRMESPTPLGKYLGCGHTVITTVLDLTDKHSCYRWPPDMSTPIASPRGGSSEAEDDEGTLLAKAAGNPAHVSAARKLAQNKQSRYYQTGNRW